MKRQTRTVATTTYSFQYHGKKIHYDVWQAEPRVAPRTVLFLGAAQVGVLGERTARHCPPSTVVIQGLPHWLVDDKDISAFATTYSKEAFKAIVAHFHIRNVDVLVESQAATSVIKLFASPEFESHLKNLVFIQPLGLNQAAFGNAVDPFSLFLHRTLQNAKHQGFQLFEWMFYRNARQILKHLDLRDPNFRIHYTTGLQQDIAVELRNLHRTGKHRVAIICGEKDRIFPPSEIQATLDQHGIHIPIQQISKVPHSPLTTKHGLLLLKAGFNTLEKL